MVILTFMKLRTMTRSICLDCLFWRLMLFSSLTLDGSGSNIGIHHLSPEYAVFVAVSTQALEFNEQTHFLQEFLKVRAMNFRIPHRL